MILRHAAAAAFAVLAIAAPLRAQNAFYTSLFERGLTNAKQGNWKLASQQLRIAAFGMLDDLPQYETAHIWAAIASERSAEVAEARVSAEKVVNAERLAHAYASLRIDAPTRSSFEALLAKYVSAERLAAVPAFANIRGTSRPLTTVIPAPVPVPVPVSAAPAPVADGNDIALRARSSWLAGDLANAMKLATDAIARDFANGPARAVLGNIAALEQRWTDVVEHFTIARTSQRLTDDEKGKLAMGFLAVGRAADADAVGRTIRTTTRVTQPIVAPKLAPPPPPAAAPAAKKQAEVRPAVVAPQPQPRPTNTPRTPPPTPTTDGRIVLSGVDASRRAAAVNSPLVAAARRSPSDALITSDPAAMLADGDQLLAQGKILAARETFARVAHQQTLNRATLLNAARGLNQTSAWRDSSSTYQRAWPLTAGEELHMFHEAVNRYELGDYAVARELLRRALPKLPASREVALYRTKIEAAR